MAVRADGSERGAAPGVARSERLFRGFFESSQVGLGLLGADGRLHRANAALAAMVGRTPAQLLGTPWSEVLDADGVVDVADRFAALLAGGHEGFEVTVRVRWPAGGWRLLRVGMARLPGPSSRGVEVVAHAVDVTEQAAAEARLRHQAEHDPLTGLPNRTLLAQRLQDALGRAPDEVGVLFIDLDRFKSVNEGLGHAAGDELLTELAERLRGACDPSWSVGRFGGDEFVVVVPSAGGPDGLVAIGERLQHVVRAPVVAGGRLFRLDASVGAALGASGLSPGRLLEHADLAMYAAKARGRGRLELFVPRLADEAAARLLVDTELRLAIDSGQVVPWYQPVCDAATGEVRWVEALARWEHPARGVLTADAFVPLAEDAGLVAALGERVLRAVLADMAASSGLLGSAAVGVNVSAHQLADPEFPDRLLAMLADAGVAPARLVVEVTESAALGDPTVGASILATLVAAGVTLAVDDFGSGYSSLAQLRDLPVQMLKVDRAFVERVDRPADRALLAAVVAMAHALGMVAVAEGVELSTQHDVVRDLGFDQAQGFLLVRPQPAALLDAAVATAALAG